MEEVEDSATQIVKIAYPVYRSLLNVLDSMVSPGAGVLDLRIQLLVERARLELMIKHLLEGLMLEFSARPNQLLKVLSDARKFFRDLEKSDPQDTESQIDQIKERIKKRNDELSSFLVTYPNDSPDLLMGSTRLAKRRGTSAPTRKKPNHSFTVKSNPLVPKSSFKILMSSLQQLLGNSDVPEELHLKFLLWTHSVKSENALVVLAEFPAPDEVGGASKTQTPGAKIIGIQFEILARLSWILVQYAESGKLKNTPEAITALWETKFHLNGLRSSGVPMDYEDVAVPSGPVDSSQQPKYKYFIEQAQLMMSTLLDSLSAILHLAHMYELENPQRVCGLSSTGASWKSVSEEIQSVEIMELLEALVLRIGPLKKTLADANAQLMLRRVVTPASLLQDWKEKNVGSIHKEFFQHNPAQGAALIAIVTNLAAIMGSIPLARNAVSSPYADRIFKRYRNIWPQPSISISSSDYPAELEETISKFTTQVQNLRVLKVERPPSDENNAQRIIFDLHGDVLVYKPIRPKERSRSRDRRSCNPQ